MEFVLRETLKELDKGVPCVLATVIRAKGSTPQKAGAKLLVRKDGSGAGTLGGGCIEGNIWVIAKTLLENHEGPLTNKYLLNEDIAARDGMVCGGSIYLFLDPIREPERFLPFIKEILAVYKGDRAVVLATLVKSPIDSDFQVGAKLLVREDGLSMGTFGSSELDIEVVKRAGTLMPHGNEACLETLGEAEIFLEPYPCPPTLVLMGGGHVNKAVAPLAKTVGFQVYVIDDRPEFANHELFPDAKATIAKAFDEALSDVPLNRNTYIIVATRGHRDDDRALEAAVRTEARYLGLLGSKRKVILVFEELMKKGVAIERIKDIHAPIGLDIHARTPEEIALSIVAELVKFRLGGVGNSMKLEGERICRLGEKVESNKLSTRGSGAGSN
jgi:xanthine dehydrogenase accessory factor